MGKKEIFSYLTRSIDAYTLQEALLNLLVTFTVVMFVFFIYKITSRGVLFNTGFGLVIILTGLVTSVIMMTIQSNLAMSLGMVGALSIIRYRSAIKDPRDTGFIFWSVAMGLSAGTGNFGLAVASALLVGGLILIYSFIIRSSALQLIVITAKSSVYDDITKAFDAEKVSYKLRMREKNEKSEEYIFEIRSKNSDGRIVEAISAIDQIFSVNVVSGGEEK